MKNVDKSEWKNLVGSPNSVILDVRTPEEWQDGIQKDAETLNFLDSAAFMDGLQSLDKSKTYYVYCRSGGRSAQACSIMDQQGFADTYNLLGGMLEWDGEVIPYT